ncbi:MAG TPA: PEGA domain-containing protein [Gemmatimonadales bacterium]|nr:PEGA domain-containing protein [Gemmatimonadales bacterium]
MTPRSLVRHILLSLTGGLLLSACATLIQGTSQEVSIASTPTGARLIIDGAEAGRTPVAASLKRKDKHTIRIEMDGYQPFEMALGRGTSGWVWGNIVFGGIPGLAIDAITGGMYKLTPEQVQATLPANAAAMKDPRTDDLTLTVVLRPDPDWVRIGQMEPAVR